MDWDSPEYYYPYVDEQYEDTNAGQNIPERKKMTDRKDVFVIVDKGENRKSFWHKIGVAFVNKDGSLSVHLDSLPMTGKLQIRDHVERSDNQGGGGNWP